MIRQKLLFMLALKIQKVNPFLSSLKTCEIGFRVHRSSYLYIVPHYFRHHYNIPMNCCVTLAIRSISLSTKIKLLSDECTESSKLLRQVAEMIVDQPVVAVDQSDNQPITGYKRILQKILKPVGLVIFETESCLPRIWKLKDLAQIFTGLDLPGILSAMLLDLRRKHPDLGVNPTITEAIIETIRITSMPILRLLS